MTDKLQAEKAVEAPAQNATPRQHAAGSWIGMAAFFLVLALIVSFFLGILPIAPVAVATGSMEPAIGVGDVVVVCRTDPDTLQVGDVIRYRLDGYTVIHRIVERQDAADGQAQAFITQGDNNNGPDSEPVSPEQIMGRVILTVPNASRFTLWLHNVLSGS